MTREELCSRIEEALSAMAFEGDYVSHEKYGSGHINDTFLAVYKKDGKQIRYILQRMNHLIFKKPEELIENIVGVTSFLKEVILSNHGDVNRETLNVIKTKDGKNFFVDSIGSYWRAYLFVEDTFSLDKVEKPEHFYQSAVSFGHFQSLLSGYNADLLHETIPNFHNTPNRFEIFKEAIKKDVKGRVKEAEKEIRFCTEREQDMKTCVQLLKKGELPLRVTHNDTKLNNILIDKKTGAGICVIDLDTVMPGLSINDFGDSIRFGANTAEEDERDLSKVSIDLSLFELYTKGFLEGCNGKLTKKEIELLPVGAKIMTLECGMRFLTDYLEGDIYFNIHREKHNLDRCRCQFALVLDMENKWEEMNRIVARYM